MVERRPRERKAAGGKLIFSMVAMVSIAAMPTTISVNEKTRDLLRAMGEKGETYDAIIRRLIQDAGWKKLDARWNRILKEDDFIPLEDL